MIEKDKWLCTTDEQIKITNNNSRFLKFALIENLFIKRNINLIDISLTNN